jgi:alkaline phosphatase
MSAAASGFRMGRRVAGLLLLLTGISGASGCVNGPSRTLDLPEGHPDQIPKNVIVVVVDGMGFNTIDAASMWKQGTHRYQIDGLPGEVRVVSEEPAPAWSFEHFPVQLAMTTHTEAGGYDPALIWSDFWAAMGQEGEPATVTGSAASATSLSSGVKTIDPRVGMTSDNTPVVHLAQLAQDRGMAVGVVTNVPFNHATPAGFLVHRESRSQYHELARDLVWRSGATVIMGTGHPLYDDDGERLESPRHFWIPTDVWSALVAEETGFTLLESRSDFQAAPSRPAPPRVFGLARAFNATQFNRRPTPLVRSFRDDPPGRVDPAELPFETPLNDDVPTLGEMAAAALHVLEQASDEGFFLMVEAGAGDWGGHWNILGRLIEDMVDLETAMDAILRWVDLRSSWSETLVVVTSDHETGHLSGPGSGPGWVPLENRGPGALPGHAFHHTYHTNQLVPLFARGAGSEALRLRVGGRLDPVRGPYLDNTDLANWLLERWDRTVPVP